MRLTFIGADHEVTGSCHFLEACGLNILIDCGMEQGPDEFENQEIPVAASEIEAVLLTHAHIDHSGNLPLLYQRGFRGQIFTTEATRDLSCTVRAEIEEDYRIFVFDCCNRCSVFLNNSRNYELIVLSVVVRILYCTEIGRAHV